MAGFNTGRHHTSVTCTFTHIACVCALARPSLRLERSFFGALERAATSSPSAASAPEPVTPAVIPPHHTLPPLAPVVPILDTLLPPAADLPVACVDALAHLPALVPRVPSPPLGSGHAMAVLTAWLERLGLRRAALPPEGDAIPASPGKAAQAAKASVAAITAAADALRQRVAACSAVEKTGEEIVAAEEEASRNEFAEIVEGLGIPEAVRLAIAEHRFASGCTHSHWPEL